MRKTWQKPKLAVLVRGRPEEFVLGPCKELDVPGISGPAIEEVECIQNLVNCELCQELAAS